MKVLHIFHELKFSGAETMYVDAAPIFQKLGCKLSVVATAQNLGEFASYFEKAGYTVFHKPFLKGKVNFLSKIKWKLNIFAKIAYCLKMISFVKANHYDVIHIHASGMRWWMSLIAWWCGVRCVYTFHNVFVSRFYILYVFDFLQRWSAKNIFGCRFQTISRSVYENEKNRYFNNTQLIYNWYGNKRFHPANDREKQEARTALGIPQDALVLTSIGGCSHVKRHSDIILALPKIVERYANTFYLHLGKGVTENDEMELAKQLGVDKVIRFCGNIREVREYLISTDIYLMTSKFEGIPITTIEAMACQIPCVLYNVPGLKDFNVENENSKLVDPDYHILADEVLRLYPDTDKMKELAANGKSFVDKNFWLDANAEKIFELYK